MKGFCYIALIIGFFVFYQQNPVYAIIVIALFVGVYLFFKSRSSGSRSRGLGFFSGKNTQQDSKIDDLITLMMIQQLMNSPSQKSDNQIQDNKEKEDKHIDKIKEEVLELLEDN